MLSRYNTLELLCRLINFYQIYFLILLKKTFKYFTNLFINYKIMLYFTDINNIIFTLIFLHFKL